MHEAWTFSERRDDVCDAYVKCFAREKYANSEIPPADRDEFMRELLAQEGIELSAEDMLLPNAARRALAKLLLNSLVGGAAAAASHHVTPLIVWEIRSEFRAYQQPARVREERDATPLTTDRSRH